MSDLFEQQPFSIIEPFASGFLSFQDSLDEVPPLDSFEADIDFGVAAFNNDLELFTVDYASASFSTVQSDAATHGSPSALTSSSSSSSFDDVADSGSFYSSFYNSPHISSSITGTTDTSYASSGQFVDVNFQSLSMDAVAVASAVGHGVGIPDFGTQHNTVSADDYFSYNQPLLQGTVSPSHISAHISLASTVPASFVNDQEVADPKRKYKCTLCPRAFKRRFNLKTHMDTHNSNRVKLHTCPHASCMRSFSRKHDLGRHLVSIHKEDGVMSPPAPAQKTSTIGVGIGIGITRGTREWCDRCGKGWVGPSPSCDCLEVESSHASHIG